MCPCQPKSEFSQNRPTDGPTTFLVPTSTLDSWSDKIAEAVDLKALGVFLLICHSSSVDTSLVMTTQIRDTLKTVRDPNIQLSRTKAVDEPSDRGYPSAESTSIWILTTWQSWEPQVAKHFKERHDFSYTEKKVKKKEREEISRILCGTFVVDECHMVKTAMKGPWKIIGSMKQDWPDARGWCVGLSGTIISADPTDIMAPLDIFRSSSWDDSTHPLHNLRPTALRDMKRLIDRAKETEQEKDQNAAKDAVRVFAARLPNVLIRRHEDSRWYGERLMELPPLNFFEIKVKFPQKYHDAYATMISHWKQQNMTRLLQLQTAWDANRHQQAFLKSHPVRPTELETKSVINTSRMLRVCSDIPHLSVVTGTVPSDVMRWTNEGVIKACMNSADARLKAECPLAICYPDLIKTCTKLRAIEQILSMKKYKTAPALIMSSFPEMTLLIERVSLIFV